MIKKIKEFFSKFSSKRIIILAFVLLALILIIMFFINSHRLTKLEKIKVTEYSDKIINYVDCISLYPEDKGRYINFAVEYLYDKDKKTEYEFKDVNNIIKEVFNIEYTERDMVDMGITDAMYDRGVSYNPSTGIFKYNPKNNRSEIANTKIVKYEISKIKKKNKNNFVVTYNKYVVENPYEMLNYYNNYNIDAEEKFDTTDISEYLKGNRNVSVIKNIINKDNIDKFGSKDGTVKFEYLIKDSKLIIKE